MEFKLRENGTGTLWAVVRMQDIVVGRGEIPVPSVLGGSKRRVR